MCRSMEPKHSRAYALHRRWSARHPLRSLDTERSTSNAMLGWWRDGQSARCEHLSGFCLHDRLVTIISGTCLASSNPFVLLVLGRCSLYNGAVTRFLYNGRGSVGCHGSNRIHGGLPTLGPVIYGRTDLAEFKCKETSSLARLARL